MKEQNSAKGKWPTFSRSVLAIFLLALVVPTARAENWPGWRGPKGNSHSSEKDFPLKWSDTENVRWKVALPGPGNSSPIVWDHRVFITQSYDKAGQKRGILCFDRTKGDKLWEKFVEYADKEPTHGTNPFNAGTPVTDGKRVVACYGSAGVHCYDLDGKELWQYDLGKLHHIWGTSISPILYKNLVILWCGPGERQFLLALDLEKGEKVYQTDIPGGKFGTSNKEWLGSWCTPVIARVGERDEMIIGVPDEVRGYDPLKGEMLWSCTIGSPLMYTSAAVSPDGIVTAFYGYGGAAMAVKAGGSGDVTKTHRLWIHNKGNPQRIGSPVILGKHVYLVSATGLAHCFDLETGKDLWKERLSDKETWGSPILAGDRFYIGNAAGDVFVFRANPEKFEILARNELGKGELIRSTVALSNGEIFIRTYRQLWCISEKK